MGILYRISTFHKGTDREIDYNYFLTEPYLTFPKSKIDDYLSNAKLCAIFSYLMPDSEITVANKEYKNIITVFWNHDPSDLQPKEVTYGISRVSSPAVMDLKNKDEELPEIEKIDSWLKKNEVVSSEGEEYEPQKKLKKIDDSNPTIN